MPQMEAELKHGKCQLCGEDDKDLWFFILGDYLGFTCHACMLQLEESQPRRFGKFLEQTEPAE